MSVQILHGDCRKVLKTLPDDSVHCVVTSPPYWNLRSYLPEGHADKHLEIGSEPTLQEWVDTMVEVFREVRRVLRPDGTLWLNLGDAYAGSGRGGNGDAITGVGKDESKRPMTVSARRDNHLIPRSDVRVGGLKPKDMMGQPWRVAFALQADGWWLRQEIIWHKPNPMPESTRDRCTKAHEHVFLLSKSERYWYGFEAMQESVIGTANARKKITPAGCAQGDTPHTAAAHQVAAQHRKTRNNGVNPKAALATAGNDGGYAEGKSERMGWGAGWRNKQNESFSEAISEAVVDTRNPRSVWTIPTHGFKGAHFATFPPALAERCITAGTSSIGACPHCGAQWSPVSEAAHSAAHDGTTDTKYESKSTAGRLAQLRQAARERGEEYSSRRVVTGSAPGCDCADNAPVPCVVLDPFGGSGTVGLVADRQHKSAILIDLDERNVPMATERIKGDSPLFAEVA